jgi:hypothetical protein
MRELWTHLRHLVAKDWRSVRRWAALCWLSAGGAWLLVLYPDPHDFLVAQGGLTVGALIVFLPALVVAHLFQGDSPLDTDAFWRTRPISAVEQLVSKLIVTGLGIALPWALLTSAPLALRHLDMTARQMAVTLATMTAIVAVGGATVALGALLTGHLVTGALVSVILYAALATALMLSYRIWEIDFPPVGIVLSLSGLWLCLLLVVPLALYLLYRTRRAALAGGVLVAGLGLGLPLNHPWVSTVGQALMPAVPTPPPPWPEISVAVEPGTGETYDAGRGKTAAWVKMAVKGLPPGYSLVQADYEATARTSKGEQHERRDKYPVDKWGLRTNEYGWVRYPSLVTLGCTLWGTGDTGKVEVFRLDASSSLQAVRGTVRFLIVRPFVAARYPVVSGGHAQGRGYRLDFDAASGSQPPRVRYEAAEPPFFIASNPLRNAWFRDPASGTCLNAERREILTTPPPPLRIEEVTPSRSWANNKGLVADYSWAKELVVLSGEVVGSIGFAFELEWGRPAKKS